MGMGFKSRASHPRHNQTRVPPPNISPAWAQKDTEMKISQVADDTTVFTSDKRSTFEIISTIELFSKVSGLKLNMQTKLRVSV